MVEESSASLDANGREYLSHIRRAAERMGHLIEDLLKLARVTGTEVVHQPVDLSRMARQVIESLQAATPDRHVEWRIAEGVTCNGDPRLLRVVLENLLSNAAKYSSKQPQAVVEFGLQASADGTPCSFVRDNGAGFDMQRASKLFVPFQRLHTEAEFPGTGVGLATVQRVIQKHRGRLWAESQVGQGPTFYFTLPVQAGLTAPAE
jgi:light-regulated signal transduction histidine kinase (bacteriophytochrome)